MFVFYLLASNIGRSVFVFYLLAYFNRQIHQQSRSVFVFYLPIYLNNH